MPQPVSNETWSNYGWRFPNIYQQPTSQFQTGDRTGGGYNYGGQYQPNPLYVNPQMMGGAGALGFPPQGASAQDPNYWTQFLYPAALSAQQTQIRTAGRAAGTKTAEELAAKYGLKAEGEATPSQRYRLKSNWADAMQRVDEQAMRSGMPLSSSVDKSREQMMQNYLEGLSRADIDANLEAKKALLNFISQYSA